MSDHLHSPKDCDDTCPTHGPAMPPARPDAAKECGEVLSAETCGLPDGHAGAHRSSNAAPTPDAATWAQVKKDISGLFKLGSPIERVIEYHLAALEHERTLHAQAVAALEEELRELRADIAELTAAMAESEPRLMAEHAAVLACIPFVNLCRRWFDGTDLHISRASLHQDEPEIGELLRVAARALDATRGFLPMPGGVLEDTVHKDIGIGRAAKSSKIPPEAPSA